MFEAARVAAMPPGHELGGVLGECEPADLDQEQTLVYLAAVGRMQSWQESVRYDTLAHFADMRGWVPDNPSPYATKLVQPGGDGTPKVDEHAADEIAALTGVSDYTAGRHLAVALDLRHRLPCTRQALAEGRIAGWRAAMIAAETRRLSQDLARSVDAAIAGEVSGLGSVRLRNLIRQAVIDADPEGADAAEEDAKPARGVHLDPPREDNLQSGWFCADPADVLRFDRTVDLIADWLGQLGDTTPKTERRATALGIIANPHRVLALLEEVRHAGINVPGDDPVGDDLAGNTVADDTAGDDADATDVEPAAEDDVTSGAGRAAPRRPPDFDVAHRAAFPEATLYVHFTRDQYVGSRDGSATLEGHGPITTTYARTLLRNGNVIVRPVIDLDGMTCSDDRFSRGLLREAVVLTDPVCIFPFCDRNARKNPQDHTIPVPQGRTEPGNLSPPCNRHHDAKTHGGWQLSQPHNGIYVWRSPTGQVYVVDRRGTARHLG